MSFDYIEGQTPGIFRARVRNGIPRHLTREDVGRILWAATFGVGGTIFCMKVLSGPDEENYMTMKASHSLQTIRSNHLEWRFAPDYVTPFGNPISFDLLNVPTYAVQLLDYPDTLVYYPADPEDWGHVIGAFEQIMQFPTPSSFTGEVLEVTTLTIPDIE